MSLQCDNLSGELQDQWSSSYRSRPLAMGYDKDPYASNRHYENLPMQYTQIFKVVKNENFQ